MVELRTRKFLWIKLFGIIQEETIKENNWSLDSDSMISSTGLSYNNTTIKVTQTEVHWNHTVHFVFYSQRHVALMATAKNDVL